jgi:serine/threonine protein phosphatase PrpC
MNDSSPLSVAGWTLALGEASLSGPAAGEFRAIYRGEDFGAPRRGLLALVARGDGGAAAEAAEIAARLFAEGYFGALDTLSPALAAARALASANAWLFQQSRSDPQRAGMAASLCALICPASKKLLVAHIGENRAYLRRAGALRALTMDHVRPLASGGSTPTRGLGFDREAQADLVEIDAEPGDRLILIGAGVWRGVASQLLVETLNLDCAAQDLALAIAGAAPGGAAIVVDALAAPEPQPEDIAADLAGLPIGPPPQEGDRLDGFVVGRTLYRGQYTLLKRARDTIGDRDVVLKLPLPAMAQDPVFHAGFLREAWIGARVRSRWTVDYIDLPKARRSRLYLVMPFYRGETLDARLRRTPPVSLAEGAGIAIALCDAIADLARHQVVHRDIKPENVFLLASGEIKLLDLGLAALPGLDGGLRDDLGGTTRYMAPELFRGVEAGPRSEVFSLGVTLYRMFSGGGFPFGRKEKLPLARARPDLPAWLGRIVARAIETDPQRRFASTAEVRDALESGLAHEDWDQRPARRLNPLMIWRALASALALLCLALAMRGR